MRKYLLLLVLAIAAAAAVASIGTSGAFASTACSATANVPTWGAFGSNGPNGAAGTGKLTPGAHVSCNGGSTVTVKLCLQYENVTATSGGYIATIGGVYTPQPVVNIPWTSTLCNTETVANNSDYSGPTSYPIPPGSKYFQDCSQSPYAIANGSVYGGGGGDGSGSGGGNYLYRTDVKVTATDSPSVTTGDVYSSTGIEGVGCTQPHTVKCNFITGSCSQLPPSENGGQVSPYALPPPEGNDNGEYCDIEMFGIEPLPNGTIFMLPMHFVCGGVADYVELVISRGLYRIAYGSKDAPPISKYQWTQGYGVPSSFEEGWTIGLFYTCQHSTVPNAFFEQDDFQEIAAGGNPEVTESAGWTQFSESVIANNCS